MTTTETDEENKRLFNIEGFFRIRSDHKAVLKLDEMILRNDISDAEKMTQVNQFIAETIKAVQEGVTENER